MAASHLPWPADHLEPAEKRRLGIGAGLLSIGPWNTGADGCAGCEDMPRKPVDIRPTDYPVRQKRECCALFLPSDEDRFGRGAHPGSRDSSLAGSQGSTLNPRRAYRNQYLHFSRFF